jgi:ATP-dependent Clp endopeptidase proteolytic subunit ClpP
MSCGVSRRVANLVQHAPDHQTTRIEFRDAGGSDAVEILLYEFIGLDWWTGEGMTAKRFADELSAAADRPLIVRINSPGGDVWDGYTIFNQLLQHGPRVTTVVEGIAASAASLIMMAGDEIQAAEISQIMIHDAWTWTVGNEQELRELADVLAKLDGQLASVYAAKAGKSVEEFRALMDRDTYLTGKEARELGIIDRLINEITADDPPAATGRSEWRNHLTRLMRAKIGLTSC